MKLVYLFVDVLLVSTARAISSGTRCGFHPSIAVIQLFETSSAISRVKQYGRSEEHSVA